SGARPGTGTAPSHVSRPASGRFGSDLLLNDRSTDTYPHITQSETAIAVTGSNLMAGWNDSGQYLSNGDLTGYARSSDGGVTWTDMGAPTTPLGVVSQVFGDPVLAADRVREGGQTAVFYFANLVVLANGTSIVSVH